MTPNPITTGVIRSLHAALRAPAGRGRPPKTFDNSRVRAFIDPYCFVEDLCEDFPVIDDIFAGVLAAKTPGDTGRRTLSRNLLFQILSRCPVIDTASVQKVMHRGIAPRTAQAYAALARCTSLFVGRFLDTLSLESEAGELPQPIRVNLVGA